MAQRNWKTNMNITKQELHEIIKEELIAILNEVAKPEDINWEIVGKNYLKALYHKGGNLQYEEAKQKVRQEVRLAQQTPGGLEDLRNRVQKELDVDITVNKNI